MYSWSIRNVKEAKENENALKFPFNQYFAFFILALTAVLTSIIATGLRKDINGRKTDINYQQCDDESESDDETET